MQQDIALRRLRNQAITGAARSTPAGVVAWLGAVQAQEYGPAKWAVALRRAAATSPVEIERAFNQGHILRTHVMRPTWHFVARNDIRWMQELTGPRVHLRMAPYNRRLELDRPVLTRATAAIERALGNGRFLTRAELAAHLADVGIAAAGQRLAHVVMHAELEGIICSGPRRGHQFTYALLADRAPQARRLTRDEALATLTRRYLLSHGPATVHDFVWWSGLLTGDATRGFELVRARPEPVDGVTYWSVRDSPEDTTRNAAVHLLPVYDEYLVAYRDRTAVPHRPPGVAAVSGRLAALQHPLVIRGQVAGSWRVDGGRIDVAVPGSLSRSDRRALEAAAARYSSSLGVPLPVNLR